MHDYSVGDLAENRYCMRYVCLIAHIMHDKNMVGLEPRVQEIHTLLQLWIIALVDNILSKELLSESQ